MAYWKLEVSSNGGFSFVLERNREKGEEEREMKEKSQGEKREVSGHMWWGPPPFAFPILLDGLIDVTDVT